MEHLSLDDFFIDENTDLSEDQEFLLECAYFANDNAYDLNNYFPHETGFSSKRECDDGYVALNDLDNYNTYELLKEEMAKG